MVKKERKVLSPGLHIVNPIYRNFHAAVSHKLTAVALVSQLSKRNLKIVSLGYKNLPLLL